MADPKGEDVILCQITSQFVKDNYAVPLDNSDFKYGALHNSGNVRPNRMFTAEKSIIIRKIGTIKPELFKKITNTICVLIKL